MKWCYFVLILVPLPWADGVVLHTVTLGRERVKAKELLDHPSFKASLDGMRNGNDATRSACEKNQLWPSDCPPTSKRTLCGFITSSLQQENAATTLYPASTTWMRHPCILSCPRTEHWNSVGAKQCQ